MTIQELFIASNDILKGVVTQIADGQWDMPLPAHAAMKPTLLKAAVQYHTYD